MEFQGTEDEFRKAGQAFLNENPGKTLADFHKEYGTLNGKRLKIKDPKTNRTALKDPKQYRGYDVAKAQESAKQTVGEPASTKASAKGLERHHKRMVQLYAPFFEGLNDKETKELAQWFVDEGAPLGDVEQNFTDLTKRQHHDIHNWMRENRVEVSKAKFPSFKDWTLNERLPAALTYLENVQAAVDEKLNELQLNFSGGSATMKKALKVLPIIGTGVTALTAAGQAMAGDIKGAGGTLVDEALSEIGMDPAAAMGDMAAPMEAQARIQRRQEVEQRSEEARKRGGRWKANIGGMEITAPELGISEWLGIN